jgi:DNA-binding transcriptional MocR family regulator
MAQQLPQATYTRPDGGFFTWVRLPDGIDAAAMLPRAVAARVAYVPGTAFHADGRGGDHVRLSFCFPTPERLVEGVRRLTAVVEAEQELLRTFRSTLGPGAAPVAGDADRPASDTA